MEKLDLTTPNFTNENIAKLAELFPKCVTEKKNDKGEIEYAIDFDALRQEFSDTIVEGHQERYSLNWPGKREALVTANTPISKTLRPSRNESVDFDTTKNIFIEGDNLDALKLLQETYLNKIKMIYIDPPYNTGKDFVYRDNFSADKIEYDEASGQRNEEGGRLVANPENNGRFHSDWLSMIYPRLKLAHNLLRDDGVIFISIDDNEQINLKKICDEIFGEENFVANVCVINNLKGRNDKINIATAHEYLLIYQKSKFVSNGVPLTEEQLKEYKFEDENGEKYALRDLRKRGRPDRREDRPNMYFTIYYNKKSNVCSLTKTSDEDTEIVPLRGDKTDGRWRWGKDTVKVNLDILHPKYSKQKNRWDIQHRVYLNPAIRSEPIDEEADDNDKDLQRTSKPKSFWWGADISTDVANREFKKLFDEFNPDYPKSPFYLEKLLHMATSSGDIVLDFFAGYSTTAHAVIELNALERSNRKFLMVQLPETTSEKSDVYKAGYKNIAEISKERIRRAGKKIREDNADKEGIENLDTGFRVFKIDSSNMVDVTLSPDEAHPDMFEEQVGNIKKDRSPEDLLFQVLLDWGVDLSLPIDREDIEGKEVFFVDGNALAACFDEDINEDFVKKLAEKQPLRVVFRDDGFSSDSVKINVEQIFELKSPSTDIKVI